MSLTRKYTLITAVLLLGLMTVIGLLSSSIFLSSHQNAEAEAMEQSILRLHNVVSQRMEAVQRTSLDWATWTDMYDYTQGLAPEFVERNLPNTVFQTLDIQLLIILNARGQLLYGQVAYPVTGIYDLVDAQSIAELNLPRLMFSQPYPAISRSGYTSLNGETFYISARPILDSSGNGPSQGILVFGRRLDEWEARRISDRYLQEVQLAPFQPRELPGSVLNDFSQTGAGTGTALYPLDGDSMRGYLLLRDFSGNPLAVFYTDYERTLMHQLRDSGRALAVALVASALIYILLSYYLPRRMIIDPINRLGQGILRIGKGGDFSARLDNFKEEEVARLGQTINQALDELQSAQRKQREGEQVYHTLFNASLGGIFIETMDGEILDCNQAACRIYGYTPGEMLGKTVSDLVPPQTFHQLANVAQTLAQQGQLVVQTSGLRKNGEVFPKEVSIQALNLSGEMRAVVFVRDISEEVRLRQKLESYARELEQRVSERTTSLEEINEELNNFAFSVSHDLRAPLRAMEGFATALHEDYAPQLGTEGREYAGRIVEAARWMDRMILDLLAYSRLARAQVELEMVSLSSLVRKACTQLQAEIQETGALIKVEEPLSDVLGQPVIVQQVVTNLLSNAIKFYQPGREPCVTFRTERRGNFMRLWVVDNGIGIAPQNHDKIFRVFERLHGMETYPGNGIGLAIVRKAVQRMGGQVGVVSHLGEGSQFWIELRHG